MSGAVDERTARAPQRIGFASFGVRMAVVLDDAVAPEVADAVRAALPPGATAVDPASAVAMVSVGMARDRYVVTGPGGDVHRHREATAAVHQVDRDLRAVVSLVAPQHVFIHAGVVAGAHGAIVVPGRSWSGKTTLVGALIGAGAAYASDEYAVLDDMGMVHPYPRALSFRGPAGERIDRPAEDLGSVASAEPMPVALIVSTAHRAGAAWNPLQGTAAAGASALVANAVAARVRPGAVMAAAAAASRSARFLEGERGEAAEAAAHILALAGGRPVG